LQILRVPEEIVLENFAKTSREFTKFLENVHFIGAIRFKYHSAYQLAQLGQYGRS
jgi:hypothetical protein